MEGLDEIFWKEGLGEKGGFKNWGGKEETIRILKILEGEISIEKVYYSRRIKIIRQNEGGNWKIRREKELAG